MFQDTYAAYRGYGTRVFLPNLDELAAMEGKMPYGFLPFDSASMIPSGIVTPQGTARGYCSQPEGCYITHLVGSSRLADGSVGNFVVQFYDTQRKALWTAQPILFANALGSAGKPFWLKRLYHLPASAQLQCRVINLSTQNNTIQVVAWGVRD